MSQGQPRRPQAGGQDYNTVGLSKIVLWDMATFSTFLASLQPGKEHQKMLTWCRSVRKARQNQKGGPAATMQSAATRNEQAGFVSHWLASDAAADQGVTVTENDIPGARLVTESVAEQVL